MFFFFTFTSLLNENNLLDTFTDILTTTLFSKLVLFIVFILSLTYKLVNKENKTYFVYVVS